MKRLAMAGAVALLAGCGAEGDPLQPQAGLGIGIGPNGIRVSPRVTVSDGVGRVSAGPGGVSAGAGVGPVAVGASL